MKLAKITPQDIFDEISKTVVGQDEAKKRISFAMFDHMSRTFEGIIEGSDVREASQATLLMGSSGSGKTFLVRAAVEAVRQLTRCNFMPIVEVDCTSLSSVGWQGNSLEDVIYDTLKETEAGAITSAVIYLDEIDKLCIPAVGKGGTDHNKQTQYGILKIVEGCLIKKGLPTHNMLFVMSGNFAQIRHNRKADVKPTIGFKNKVAVGKPKGLHKQLQEGGMATQLAGRISSVAELQPLGRSQIMKILKNLVSSYRHDYLMMYGYDLKISRYHMNKIVDKAMSMEVGARALRSCLVDYLHSVDLQLVYVIPPLADAYDDEDDEDDDDDIGNGIEYDTDDE